MLEDRYLKEVRRALFDRGVWGAEARTITEQLADHYHEGVTARLESGEDSGSAAEHSLAALGTPGAIAEVAAAQLQSRSRLARHPWLIGGVGVFVATVAGWGVLLFGVLRAAFPSGNTKEVNISALEWGVPLLNWLPFLASCALLVWWARRSVGSWKTLLIASVAVGLATSAFVVRVHPPLHGPGSGRFMICTDGFVSLGLMLGSLASSTLRHFTGLYSWRGAFGGSTLLRMLLPVLSVICARYLTPRLKASELSIES